MDRKQLFKNIIKVGVVAAILFFGAPILAVLGIGYAALKSVDVVGAIAGRSKKNPNVNVEVSPEVLKRNEELHNYNSKRKFFDFSTGQWNIRELPVDMYPTLGLRDSEQATFSCSGVENIVQGSVKKDLFGRQKAEFFFIVNDEKKAQDVSDTIARSGLVGTTVERLGDKEFKIISDNAVDISTLVKQFYPPRTFEVAREVTTTKQYLVSGCSSYEDALREFKENRHRYAKADYTSVSYQNIIDGHAEPAVSDGFKYDPRTAASKDLPLGTFVIEETTMDYYSRNVTINGGVDMTDEAMRSDAAAAVKFVIDDKVEDRCSHEPKYSNGLKGVEPERSISTSSGKLTIANRETLDMTGVGASMFIVFSSQEELVDVLSKRKPLTGQMVLVDKQRPVIGEGEFLLEVPADAALLSTLALKGDEAENLFKEYGRLGVDRRDIELSLVARDLKKYDYISAEVVRDIDMSKALVNNIPAKDFTDRCVQLPQEGRAEKLAGEKETLQWMRNAELIRSVDMELDLRNRRLILTSQVQTNNEIQTKSEYRELTLDQMNRIAGRGQVSQAELKDLVMRLHPDFFSLYQNPDGSSRYEDPILDFVEGRSPKVRETKKAEVREAKTEKKAKAEKVEKTEKKAAVKKTSKARRMA